MAVNSEALRDPYLAVAGGQTLANMHHNNFDMVSNSYYDPAQSTDRAVRRQPDAKTLTLVLGAPRSGTSWLAKIFDSHPDVLYRHEPDLAVLNTSVPKLCLPADMPANLAATRRWVAEMIATRNLKAVGKMPVFAKTGDRPGTRLARTGMILGLNVAAKILPAAQRQAMVVPPWFGQDGRAQRHVVIKSVSSFGRVGLIAAALPEARIVAIIRNPLAQIASRLHGYAAGHFRRFKLTDNLLMTDEAKRLGLTEERLRGLSNAELMAWEWVILTDKAMAEVADNPRATVVRFRDLVQDPHGQARRLLDFAGLPWHPAVARFVTASTRYLGPDFYFHVRKDSEATLHKWRYGLTAEDQARIGAIVSASAAAQQYFPDLFH